MPKRSDSPSGTVEQRRCAEDLVDRFGTTFAKDAGVTLRDKPAPLWQLLVVAQLLSTRIRSDAALATARELWAAGWTTPDALLESTWRRRVTVLGRGGYKRYDESTATRLAENATALNERWKGDLRKLRDAANGDVDAIGEKLQEFTGIGPAGAAIFLREVQAVWPDVRPCADELVLKGARVAGLPADADALAALVAGDDLARLAAALVRVARQPSLVQ